MENKDFKTIYTELINNLVSENRKQLKEIKVICLACIISTMVVVTSLVGGALYFFSSYAVDVEDTITYEQYSDGDSSIINGDQYRDNSINKSEFFNE